MAVTREKVDKALARVGEELEEVEAKAGHAGERLVRLASLQPADEVDPDEVRAAADDYAEAAQRMQSLQDEQSRLRELIT